MRHEQTKLDRIIKLATWITAIVLAVVLILPLTESRYFDVSEEEYLWDYLSFLGDYLVGTRAAIVFTVLAFPVIAAPLLAVAAYTRDRGLRCGLIGVVVLIRYGWMLYYVMVDLDEIASIGITTSTMNLTTGNPGLLILAHVGLYCSLVVGVTGGIGRLACII